MERRLKLSARIALLAACVALPATATAGVLPPLDPDPPAIELPGDPLPPLPPLLPPLPPLPGVDPPPVTEPPGVTAPITVPPGLTVGEPLVLRTTARDPDAPINSIAIDFDDGGGFLSESACRLRPPDAAFTSNRATSFSVPYAFTRPGLHTVRVTLGSGDCGPARQTTTQTIEVNVASAKPSLARVRAGATASTAGAACAYADALPTEANRRKVQRATVCVLNHVRRQNGMAPFRRNRKLRRAGALHNRYMLEGRFFAHQGPGEPPLGVRLRRVGYPGGAGENLGAGSGVPYATPRGMVDGWMNSPVHRANVLESAYRTVGVAVAVRKPYDPPVPGATYTAEFGTTRR